MLSRLLAPVALVVLTAHATPSLSVADETKPPEVAPLTSAGSQAFQFRATIGAGPEQLVADISFSPPDRRCLVLRDSFDGLPLMIASDGLVWLYDPIGGQILKIRAEPEFIAEHKADGSVHVGWGMRADFPDPASRTTLRLDFGAIFQAFSESKTGKLVVNRAARSAEFADGNKVQVKLIVDENVPPRPTAFSIDSQIGTRRALFQGSSFVYGAPVPKWHREMNSLALFKHLRTRAVRDKALFSPEERERLTKVVGLLQGGGLFIIRPALRDPALRAAFEKNSPIHLDFEEVKANDTTLRTAWLKALREQEFEFPDISTAGAAK